MRRSVQYDSTAATSRLVRLFLDHRRQVTTSQVALAKVQKTRNRLRLSSPEPADCLEDLKDKVSPWPGPEAFDSRSQVGGQLPLIGVEVVSIRAEVASIGAEVVSIGSSRSPRSAVRAPPSASSSPRSTSEVPSIHARAPLDPRPSSPRSARNWCQSVRSWCQSGRRATPDPGRATRDPGRAPPDPGRAPPDPRPNSPRYSREAPGTGSCRTFDQAYGFRRLLREATDPSGAKTPAGATSKE